MIHYESQAPLPPLFGNFPGIIASLDKGGPEEFSFAVFGDTKGANGVFEELVEKLRKKPVDLAFLLGDAYWETFPFFRAEITDEYRLPFPVFYVIGNHELDNFSLEKFEKTFGPTIFSFEYKNCLFIILRVVGDSAYDQASINFLKSLETGKKRKYRKIFVFMHVPPPVQKIKKFCAPAELLKLFQQLKVDYAFASHYHGYAHATLKNITYIVTGGAGTELEKSVYGQFHHAIVMTVGKDNVSETIIPLEECYDMEDKIERFAAVAGYRWLCQHVVIVSILNMLLAFSAVFLLIKK